MALVARYHRRGLPKRAHEGYGTISPELRRTVRTLGAILRVAEGLDRSHQQSVASIEVVPGGQDYLLRLTPDGDTELEVWAAQRSVTPLERVLRRIVRFEVVSNQAPSKSPRRTTQRTTRRARPTAGRGDARTSRTATRQRGPRRAPR